MQTITIKLDDSFAEQLKDAMHPYYTTKTEFIREAIRDKIKAESIQKLKSLQGLGKNAKPLTKAQRKEAFLRFEREIKALRETQ